MFEFEVNTTVTFSAEDLVNLGKWIGAFSVGAKYEAGINWLQRRKGLTREQAKEILGLVGVHPFAPYHASA